MTKIKPLHAFLAASILVCAFLLLNGKAVANFGVAATTNTLTLSGVTSSDIVNATITSGNSPDVFVQTAIPGTDEVAVTLSGTPGASTDVDVFVVRAAN